MLSDTQQTHCLRGFEYGFSDIAISKRINCPPMEVYLFRRKLGVSSDEVITNRYKTWGLLLSSHIPIAEISSLYEINDRSLQVMLWNAGYSFQVKGFKELTLDQKEKVDKIVSQAVTNPSIKINNSFDRAVAKQIGAKYGQICMYRTEKGYC